MEMAGVRDALTKCIGSTNPHNSVRATLEALKQLGSPEELIGRRGKTLADLQG
jgi:small subunit ribosomal protein S5